MVRALEGKELPACVPAGVASVRSLNKMWPMVKGGVLSQLGDGARTP